ncbi:MAG: cyanoexosortase B system-associated protein [Moorea sp. SIO2B7]|nr:cyanoexosortase B system-associated protein [Moorena sp. SIO2B7]
MSKFKEDVPISRWAVILLLILLIGIAAIPGYWSGKWIWKAPPQITNLNQIRSTRNTGLNIPGWTTLNQAEIKISGHKWSLQLIQKGVQKPVILLLQPQNDYRKGPQVEWMDINGFEKWKTDSYTKLKFTIEEETKSPVQVKARFFRAWNRRQTFAVVQWYAFPQGGHPSPGNWFWADQFAQLYRSRVPWIAVCLQIPIEPLGELEEARSVAESLAKIVQKTLIRDIFSNSEGNKK